MLKFKEKVALKIRRAGFMRIYFADTRSFAQTDTEALVKRLSALVKPKRLELYMRHRNITKLCAGALLYCALKDHGIDYLNEKSAYTELGKEYFTEKNVFFNISHSKDIACCAVDIYNVGIDCEQVKDSGDILRLAERFFSEKETEYLLSCADKRREFTRIWTMKESYVKYTSQGFSKPVSSFTCIPTDDACSLPDAFVKTYDVNGAYLSVCSQMNDFPEKLCDMTDFFL